MKQKKNQSRSLNPYSMQTHDESASSPSPRFLSLLRSKLSGGRELKLMFRNIGRKKTNNRTTQARLVRCPKCQKILQEPEDSPLYRCSRCDSVLQAKHWTSKGEVAQISHNSVQEAILLSAAEESESEDVGSLASSSKYSVKKTHHHVVYDTAASSSGARSYDSETAYKHDKSDDVLEEWLRRDKFRQNGDSVMRVSGRNSPYSVGRSVETGDWIQKGQYESSPRNPFYPTSPSPSSAYECASPFHASYVSAAEQSYNHQQNRFRQYQRGGWSGESSGASSIHFSRDTTDARHYQWSGQSSPMRDFQYQGFPGQGFYDHSSSCTATPHRSAQSEHSYPAWSSKIESYSQKGTCRDINDYVKERNHVVKHHVLPAAGGAPFVTCYYCLQLLQLSEGFLQGKRNRYLVRCGGCSGLLKFSPKEKAPTVPYTPRVLDSDPSLGDDHVSNHQEDQEDSASVDHDECCPDEGPLSCPNNDCGGDSVCKSSLSTMQMQGVAVNEDKHHISDESSNVIPGTQISEKPESDKASGIHVDQSEDAHSEHSRNEYENSDDRHELDNTIDDRVRFELEESGYERGETLDAGKETTDGAGVTMEDMEYKNEETNKTTKEAETTEDRPVSHGEELDNEDESTCKTLELTENTGEKPEFDREESGEKGYNMEEMHKFDSETSQGEGEYGGERALGEDMGDRPWLHLEEYESNYEDIQEQLTRESEWNIDAGRVPTFRLDESELGELFEPEEANEDRIEICLGGSLNDHKDSNEALEPDDYAEERVVSHLEDVPEEDENETKSIKAVEVSKLYLGEQLQQEEETVHEMLFHLDLSQDKLEQTLESGESEEDRSSCSSDANECSSRTIKLDSETAENKPGDHSEEMQDEDDKKGLTFEPYAHICSTMGPSEIVGLRHALYTTPSSPLRSPLTSPIHTPVGSPRFYPLGSPVHSPMASPLHPHMLSPLRSPINSSPSLSDVLFFGKNG